MITPSDQQRFRTDGYLFLPSFFDVETELVPIQRGIYDLIGILADKYQVPLERKAFCSETFDAGFTDLAAKNRRIAAELYDAIKQLPAFHRLLSSDRLEQLFSLMRQTKLPGIAGLGFGIRIDIPHEDVYACPWHQDYLGHLRSQNGIVFWAPLVPVTPSMGPVQLLKGSHLKGIARVERRTGSGSYNTQIADIASLLEAHPVEAPLTRPGDLLLIDFLTVHCSGLNHSDRPRWSMQMRYFDFEDPTGRAIGWTGREAGRINISAVHPEVVVEPNGTPLTS